MPTLQYLQPTDEQKATMQIYRDKMQAIMEEIIADPNVPNSRGKSLCITKIEEGSFWLNKAITHNS